MEPIPKLCVQVPVGSRVLGLGESLSVAGNFTAPARPEDIKYELLCVPATIEDSLWYILIVVARFGWICTTCGCRAEQY